MAEILCSVIHCFFTANVIVMMLFIGHSRLFGNIGLQLGLVLVW